MFFFVDRVDGRLVLHGHAARGNPLWRATRALAVFSGPHAYISAAWYDEPDVVPTWNYLAVHASGPLTVITDAAEVQALFARLAAAVGDPQADAWQQRLSPTVAAKLGGMIRWFRIDVERTEGKAKLSQHHSPARRQRLIAHLAASADPAARAVGAAMARVLDGEGPWPGV